MSAYYSYPWGYRLGEDHPTRQRWARALASGWDLRARTLAALQDCPVNKDQLLWKLLEDRCPGWSMQEHHDNLYPMLNELTMDGLVTVLTTEDAVAAGGNCATESDKWWSWWGLTEAGKDPNTA